MTTECPSLTKLTNESTFLTADEIYELQVSTYDRTVGTVVKVVCQPGLQLEGQDTVTCGAGGQWNLDPLPKCVDIPPSTTPSPGTDPSLILMIVLIVIMAVVVLVMTIICFALYHSHWRRKRDKFYGDPDYKNNSTNDTASQPYSITDRERRGVDMHTYNVYEQRNSQRNAFLNTTNVDTVNQESNTGVSRHPYDGMSPHYLYYRPYQEYNPGYKELGVEREHASEVNGDARDSRRPPITTYQNNRRYSQHRPDQDQRDRDAHARRYNQRPLSDITAYYGGLVFDGHGSSEADDNYLNRHSVRRDYYLWRDMPSSWHSLRLPRPHYRP